MGEDIRVKKFRLHNFFEKDTVGFLVIWLINVLIFAPIFGLFFGLAAGLVGGLIFGGYVCIQHYLIRIMLQICNLAPLNYIKFLDYAADRIFLRKVGGGHIFIHRTIMDYFAAIEPDNH